MTTHRNLSPNRGPNVWDKKALRPNADPLATERWALAITGATLAAFGLSRRGMTGRLIALGGSMMALRAGLGRDDLDSLRGCVRRTWNSWQTENEDVVESSSAESFPASDAPSWTPTKGGRTETPPADFGPAH